MPAFTNLRRFPEGRNFVQWTGNDSKALMKVSFSALLLCLELTMKRQVYLPALEGHIPAQMVRCIRAFLEFCYIARKDLHDEMTLSNLQAALSRFHSLREVFVMTSVRQSFNLPRQHAMMHYLSSIRAFGSPNGLCSSITESKHIKAVKKPWRRSSKYNAIGQMLLINQRLDNLAALRVEFTRRGMLTGTCLTEAIGIYLFCYLMFLDRLITITGKIITMKTMTWVKMIMTITRAMPVMMLAKMLAMLTDLKFRLMWI
jgi:hypothetical protein